MSDYFQDIRRRYNDLNDRGFSARNKTPSKRLRLLEETADLLLELEAWQSVIEGPSMDEQRRKLMNFPRALGYKPSDLQRVIYERKCKVVQPNAPPAVEVQVEAPAVVETPSAATNGATAEEIPVTIVVPEPVRDAKYFQSGLQEVELLVRGGDRDAYRERYSAVSVFIDEFNQWYDSLEGRERKRWNTQRMRLNGELTRALEVGIVYGFPEAPDWRWVLRSDDETQPYVERLIAKHGEEGERKLSHLRDKDHPNHPPWFLFLEGQGQHKMSVVALGKTKMTIGSTTTDEVFPWVGCHVYETAFQRLDQRYWTGCMESLVGFVRGAEFVRTGYDQVVFNGIENKIPKELCAKLEILEFDAPLQQVGKYSYRCIIRAPKPKFSLKLPFGGLSLEGKLRSLFDKP